MMFCTLARYSIKKPTLMEIGSDKNVNFLENQSISPSLDTCWCHHKQRGVNDIWLTR
ncbi:hypothetical protein FORC54_4198 [Vibrio vulnificus]|nr:hypothetical protein FORC54_4198 [Vibrio vulnificus]